MPTPEEIAFYNAVNKEIAPIERRMDDALQEGRWQEALDAVGEANAKRRSLGAAADPYSGKRAEALIGLGRPDEALALQDPRPNVQTMSVNTRDLALALLGRLSSGEALNHAEHARKAFSTEGSPPPVPRPKTDAEIVACVRLDRAVEGSSQDLIAEREAREVLEVYPKQAIASYILAKSLGYQGRDKESEAYWEAAVALPGPAGDEAKKVCHNLFPDRKEFAPPPPGPSVERSGPLTDNLRAVMARDRAFYDSLKRKP